MPRRSLSRRRFLASSAVLTAAPSLLARPGAAPGIRVVERRVISRRPDLYHGWPTVARRRSGELLLVCSGGREAHVCPFGRVELLRSRDEGGTWSWPRVLVDGPIDDRDAGVVETSRGTVLVTTFSSLAYESGLTRAARAAADGKGSWSAERLARWKAAHERVSPEERRKALGVWILRSTDSGLTWSTPVDSLVSSPHGPIVLSDGRLLYPGKDLWKGSSRVGVCESTDDGASWSWLGDVPERPGDRRQDYHELHGVEAPGGRIVVHIRNHNRQNSRETLQTESVDGGRTWSRPRPIGVWGLPSHLLRLRDGRLLMSYGHRRPPFGNQARVSEDAGRTWSEPMGVSEDGAGGDLGYPSTVQLTDGSLLTVWYELIEGSPRAVLRQARWELSGGA